MAVHTGCLGAVNGLSTVRDWQISESIDIKELGASNTSCAKVLSKGIQRWSGSLNDYGYVPQLLPGEAFAFLGYTSSDTDVFNTDGPRYAGPAILNSLAITWNWKSGDPISGAYNFANNGELVEFGNIGAAVIDNTPIRANEVRLATMYQEKYNGAGLDALTEVDDLVSAVLTLTKANKPYSDSSTKIGTGLDVTIGEKFLPGELTATLAITRENPVPIYRAGDQGRFTIRHIHDGVGPPLDWSLAYMMAQGAQGLTTNIEGNEIISYTQTLQFQAEIQGFTKGQIAIPDQTAGNTIGTLIFP